MKFLITGVDEIQTTLIEERIEQDYSPEGIAKEKSGAVAMFAAKLGNRINIPLMMSASWKRTSPITIELEAIIPYEHEDGIPKGTPIWEALKSMLGNPISMIKPRTLYSKMIISGFKREFPSVSVEMMK